MLFLSVVFRVFVIVDLLVFDFGEGEGFNCCNPGFWSFDLRVSYLRPPLDAVAGFPSFLLRKFYLIIANNNKLIQIHYWVIKFKMMSIEHSE